MSWQGTLYRNPPEMSIPDETDEGESDAIHKKKKKKKKSKPGY